MRILKKSCTFPEQFKPVLNNLNKGLIQAGIGVNLGILYWPDLMYKLTCDAARSHIQDPDFWDLVHTVFQDRGLYIFNMIFLCRSLLIPSLDFASDQISKLITGKELISEETRKILNTIEQALTSSAMLGVMQSLLPYIPQDMKLYLVPFVTMLPLYTRLGYPLSRYVLKNCCDLELPEYPAKATYQALQDMLPDYPKAVKLLAGGEIVINSLKTANAGNGTWTSIIKVIYDGGQQTDTPAYNPGLKAISIICLLLGTASFFNDKAFDLTSSISMILNIAYLIFNPMVSTLMCLFPILENVDTFYKYSLPLLFLIGGISLAIGIINEFSSTMNDNAVKADRLSTRTPSIYSTDQTLFPPRNAIVINNTTDTLEVGIANNV